MYHLTISFMDMRESSLVAREAMALSLSEKPVLLQKITLDMDEMIGGVDDGFYGQVLFITFFENLLQ